MICQNNNAAFYKDFEKDLRIDDTYKYAQYHNMMLITLKDRRKVKSVYKF